MSSCTTPPPATPPPEEARDRVETILADREPPVVYKKVDSTLRGNVVAEVEAVAEAVDPSLVVVAPAFPANGRRTACGYHLVEGSLVTDSPPARTLTGPPPTTRSRRCSPGVTTPSNTSVSTPLRRGPDAVADAFAESQSSGGPTIVTCDAIAKEHLESIATGADAVDGQCAFVGSGGLAKYVVLQGDGSAEEPVAADQDERPVVGVSGSVAPETLAQVRRVPDGLRRKSVTWRRPSATRKLQVRPSPTGPRHRFETGERWCCSVPTTPATSSSRRPRARPRASRRKRSGRE